MMEALTRRQLEVLNYISEVLSTRRAAPTIREIGAAFGVCVGSVQQYLRGLARKGYIVIAPRSRRGIRLAANRRAWRSRQGWQGDFDRRIGRKLEGESDLRRVFGIVRDEVRPWLDVERADLWVHDAHDRTLRECGFFAAAPAENARGRESAPAPGPVVAKAFRLRKPAAGEEPGPDGVPRPCAAVPVLARDRVLGVLRIEDRRPERLDETRLTRTAMAATALGPALERGSLHAELQRRIRLQAALVELCRSVNSPADFKQRLQDFKRITATIVDAPVFLIRVKDDDGQWWNLIESDTCDGVTIENDEPRRVTITQTAFINAMRVGDYWLLQRTPEEVRRLEAGGTTPGVSLNPTGHVDRRSASILYVPMRSWEETIGYLSVQTYRYNAHSRQDAEDLILIGEYLGMAARNALREELDRARAGRDRKQLERIRHIDRELEEISGLAQEPMRDRVRGLAREFVALRAEGEVDPGRRLAQ